MARERRRRSANANRGPVKPLDEVDLARQVRQGLEAEKALKAVEAYFPRVEERIIALWKGVSGNDIEGRERLWMRQSLLKQFIEEIKQDVNRGKTAAKKLEVNQHG